MVNKISFSGNIIDKHSLMLNGCSGVQFTTFDRHGQFSSKLMRISLIIFLLISILSGPANSQVDLPLAESQLRSLADSIARGSTEEIRSKSFNDFKLLLDEVIATEGSFSYPFDSVPSLSKHTAPDGRFRIYTWLMPSMEMNKYLYSGIIQFSEPLPDGKNHVTLTDVSELYQNNEMRSFVNGQWYGAVYYDLFAKKVKGQLRYYLLGWRGNDQFTTSKVIDVISFDDKGSLVMGSQDFIGPGDKVRHRVIFTFAAQAVMLLRHEKRKKRIVFDHLSPAVDKAEGDFRYYGPDFTYDAFRFKRGSWYYKEHLEPRNRGN